MGIQGKHAYRFVFLKSDEWQSVRLEALVREDAKCQTCGERSISNDAHHIWYPKDIWRTKPYHLVILCRPCHNFIHAIIPECITDVPSEGWEHWKKFYVSIITWRKSKVAWFGTKEGIAFDAPHQLRAQLQLLKDKVDYYEWLQYASCVKFLVEDSDFQI